MLHPSRASLLPHSIPLPCMPQCALSRQSDSVFTRPVVSCGAVKDMFWRQPFDLKMLEEGCEQQWGIKPRPLWLTIK